MLGAHGGMHQKWYNAYEETINVPLTFSNPVLFNTPKTTDILSTHVDLLPTMLGISGLDMNELNKTLQNSHAEAKPLVGRDLSQLIISRGEAQLTDEPIYFQTSDEVSEGENQTSVTGQPYNAIIAPNNIHATLAKLEGKLWKYAEYTDPDGTAPTEYELYNLTDDPIEQTNLAYPGNETTLSQQVQPQLVEILRDLEQQKALTPDGYQTSQ